MNKFDDIYKQNERYFNELITNIHASKKDLKYTDEYIIELMKYEDIPIEIMNDLLTKVNNIVD